MSPQFKPGHITTEETDVNNRKKYAVTNWNMEGFLQITDGILDGMIIHPTEDFVCFDDVSIETWLKGEPDNTFLRNFHELMEEIKCLENKLELLKLFKDYLNKMGYNQKEK